MLEAYNKNLAVTGNTVLSFPTTITETASTTINNNNTSIFLNKPGVYKVDFNSTVLLTTEGNIAVNMLINGAISPNAMATTSVDNTNYGNLNFSALVPVKIAPSGNVATLTFNYIGGAGTIILANVIVTKVA